VTQRSFRVRPEDLPRIRAILSGDQAPATPRLAATVALIRDGEAGLEVYLMRRVRKMAFAAGMHVFPGGSVDAQDHADARREWLGPDPAWWAQRFGTDQRSAQALVRAAARETFEECGVLLARTAAAADLPRTPPQITEADREAVEAGSLTFDDVLTRHHLVLDSGTLAPLAHWITPELEPRRFDTYFFLAALPPGQECREAGGEADVRIWIRPEDVAVQGLAVMTPTASVLADLAQHDHVASAMRDPRSVPVVRPVMTLNGDQLRIERVHETP
jgi:8-oxo-dGTP pyrophosphatase MutT (NUDIX family)